MCRYDHAFPWNTKVTGTLDSLQAAFFAKHISGLSIFHGVAANRIAPVK